MVAQLTFDDEGETLAGTSPEQAIDRIAQEGLAAVGANCGLGPQATLDALTAMAQPARAAGLPLTAQPNVGLPGRAIDGRLLYPNATPEYFADFATRARDLGARLVGGCCGTQPTHIHAIHQAMLDEPQSRPRQPLLIPEPSRSPPAPPHTEPEPTLLERMLRNGEWVVSVELDPPKGSNLNHLLEACEQLRDSGLVHAVDLNDNPMARARMNALATAGILQAHTGIETIPHLTPRDATIMGLQSQLLAAHATGVRNLLLVTGDPPHVGDYPGTTGVYELDAIGLTDLVTRLNQGADYAGKTIDQPTSFYAGVAVNPSAQDLDQELDRYHQKIQAGARFAMTQALFDTSQLDRFLDKLSGSSPIPLLIGIWPLTSHQLAQRLHNEVPGITVPQQIRDQLAHAGNNAHRVGLRVARRFYDEVRQRAAGVYIIPTFKRPLTALDLLC
jgi:methionine synthase / methylenetetrahydrofolate reductase(NADPH)